uniref:Ribosome biogenesis protein BOP1 homolog n=1 Tax=Cacopsylla melanoneura TaxID=428564 RepID=A0A8D9AVX1_9HEMI
MGPLSNVGSVKKRKFIPTKPSEKDSKGSESNEDSKADNNEEEELEEELLVDINNDSDTSDEEFIGTEYLDESEEEDGDDNDTNDEDESENESKSAFTSSKSVKSQPKASKSSVLRGLENEVSDDDDDDDESIGSEDIEDINTEEEDEDDEEEEESNEDDSGLENDEENKSDSKESSIKDKTNKTDKQIENNVKQLGNIKLDSSSNSKQKENKKKQTGNKEKTTKKSDTEKSDGENEDSDGDDKGSRKESKGKKKYETLFPGNTEYHNETDTSDEEDIRNTVGNIPMNWYDDLPHLGYDWSGKRILKPEQSDQLDDFLSKMENPDFWRSVKDPQTGQNVRLSDADIQLIKNIRNNKYPDPEFNEYAPWVDWFSSEVMKMPLNRAPDHKRSFIPSKSEAALVSKFVYSLKMGRMKSTSWMRRHRKDLSKKRFYMLWPSDTDAEEMRRVHNHIPAPKRFLPGHAESYNPPGEYLFNEREIKEWEELKGQVWNRKLHFIPQKYNSLREVPAYKNYMKERFTRCLDLYMCPRARVMKVKIEAEDLLPKLPDPRDLQPFPTTLALEYLGHTNFVRCICVEPQGQFLASGSDDMTVKVWEIATGRCVRTIPAGGVVRSIAWCPNTALSLLAVAADRKLLIVNPRVGDILIQTKTDDLMSEPPEGVVLPEKVKAVVNWEVPEPELWDADGLRIVLNHFKELRQVTWHGRGDYFASVMPEGANRSVLIHQLSTRKSQIPFGKAKGLIQCVLFHPVRPLFFVATQMNIRIYDLVKQEIVKKLFTHSKWISSMSVHPGGDNLLVGTFDRKVLWFDLDLSVNPYKVLKLHGSAVRSVAYHRRYPLFATCSDDLSVIISHGMIYSDLLQNPLVVPLKLLRHHRMKKDYGVFDVAFHPSQPWVFSSGSDNRILLYT